MLTLCISPVGIQVGQRGLVADLLEGLGGLVVDLEDTARSPPAATSVAVAHVEVGASAPRRLRARVVGDGAREEDWGRQLGGIVGGRLGGSGVRGWGVSSMALTGHGQGDSDRSCRWVLVLIPTAGIRRGVRSV